jgi:ABC-type transporter Mla subunit MlaD
MKDIRAFLAQLGNELKHGKDVDQEVHQILDNLNSDADRLEESGGTDVESMLDRVKELESRFAANHPVLEQTARELADALAKMGI